jgi:4-amino-4-deoxy-L-arabinose transferase-like glycosyltransferase
MVANKFEPGSKRQREDAVNLIILLSIAFLLGFYLIVTTILVAQDGIFYIERAQRLSIDPRSVVRSHPPGYPFLIFIALKLIRLFESNPSAQTLAYTAQGTTLLCRLLAIIPLYLTGKILVGPRNSFWALLILILLPYPARFGSDVLRDWPHILFLSVGFLFLLLGAEQGKLCFFGIVGLLAGLGFLIRPECAQLVLYGMLWIFIKLLRQNFNMSRFKLFCGMLILLTGFALPMIPYALAQGKIIPIKLKQLVNSSKEFNISHSHIQTEKEEKVESHNHIHRNKSSFGNIAQAIGRLIGEVSDNLMHFFLPALLIGFYYRFNKQSMAITVERFFMPFFMVLNVIMMILLYYSQGYISRRHCLPLVVFSIFYVSIGLQIFAGWLSKGFSKDCSGENPRPQPWFFILLAVGVTICLPKLLRPLRIEKKGYREVARWLKENTAQGDIISVPDHRISFYAERDISAGKNTNPPDGIDYIVSLVKDESEKPEIGGAVEKKLSLWVDKRRKKYKLIIYEVL